METYTEIIISDGSHDVNMATKIKEKPFAHTPENTYLLSEWSDLQ